MQYPIHIALSARPYPISNTQTQRVHSHTQYIYPRHITLNAQPYPIHETLDAKHYPVHETHIDLDLSDKNV
jgi:hypothetical protein